MFSTVTHRQQGFTLIELVITLAIVAILVGVVAPSFSSFMQQSRLSSQMNNLVASIHMARAEAATRRMIVTMCASSDGATCNTQNWEAGWIIFTDDTNNGNGILDGADELVRYQEALEGGNTLRETGFNFPANGRIIFNTNGFLLATAPDSGTLTLCDSRGVSDAKAIVINISGTSRAATDENNNGTPDNHNGAGNEIVCPA